jgi:hypothetical protein
MGHDSRRMHGGLKDHFYSQLLRIISPCWRVLLVVYSVSGEKSEESGHEAEMILIV